jgi:hypothetical protein
LFLTMGPKFASVLAPLSVSQTRTRWSWPHVTRWRPSSVQTMPLTGPLCACPRAALRENDEVDLSCMPIESSRSSMPSSPTLLRMSQNRTLPSVAPLARMCSRVGLQAVERIAPEWPARLCVFAPDRRSTRRTLGVWAAHATSRCEAMGDRAILYTTESRLNTADGASVSLE